MAAVTKWQDWASFALGLWLAVSPWIAGYVDNLDFDSAVATANTLAVGVFVALLAASALSLEKYIGRFWHKAH